MSTNPIQFRAWNGHKMCRVDSLSFNAAGMIWHGPGEFGWGWVDETFEGWTPDNPKPEVVWPVMRFTGLVDRNGVKIWEGDILSRYDGESIYVVQYCPVYGRYEGVLMVEHGKETENDCVVSFDDIGVGSSSVEVVGSAYANPDLLKS